MNSFKNNLIGIVCLAHCTCLALAQPSADSVTTRSKKKVRNFIIIGGASYGAALYGLNELWYSDFERQDFHFFNDNRQWKQMDKVGHFYTAYHLSRGGKVLFEELGVDESKSYLYGSIFSFVLLFPIEILDGFSSEFGASWGDLVANFSGGLLYYGQHKLLGYQLIKPKFSFTRTGFAPQRPELLGDGLLEEILKDYNGQTQWLSIDLYKFFKSSRFPKWLNLGFGYGATNMLFAREEQNIAAGLDPYRQYYLTIDIDLSYIETSSKFLNTALDLLELIHIPTPALEFNRADKMKFRPFHF